MKIKFFLSLLSGLFLISCALEKNSELASPQTSISTSISTSNSVESNFSPPNNESSEVVIHPVSLQALSEKDFNGSDLTLGEVLDENESYTRYSIRYKSGELTISGIMNIPKGNGPFPALILNHGYIDPSIYTNGRGLKREQDYFAKQGYIVLHTDYRNHAFSDKDDRDSVAVRLGYIEDAINAAYALKNSDLSTLNKEEIGMLGHSMGGGVTLGVLTIKPDLINAAVLYAPVTGDMRDSYMSWISARSEEVKKIDGLYGRPSENSEFWEGISLENFYTRIQSPILIFHGTADKDVPLEWSEKTLSLLKSENVDVSLKVYPNAPHEFISDWDDFMNSSKAFFDEHLR